MSTPREPESEAWKINDIEQQFSRLQAKLHDVTNLADTAMVEVNWLRRRLSSAQMEAEAEHRACERVIAECEALRKDAERWRWYCNNQTALMLGSHCDPNDESIDWVAECNRLADARRLTLAVQP